MTALRVLRVRGFLVALTVCFVPLGEIYQGAQFRIAVMVVEAICSQLLN